MGFLNKLTIDGNASNVKNYTAGAGINISENGVISATGGGGAVDDSLSTMSTNPVQNKVVTNAINGKQEKLVAGTGITITGNVISASGGGGTVTVDPALSTTSTNPVENRAITTEINGIKTNVATAQNDINDLDTRVQALEDGGECIDYSLDGSYASGNLTLTLSDGTTSQSTNIALPISDAAEIWAAGVTGTAAFSFPAIPKNKAVPVITPLVSMYNNGYFNVKLPTTSRPDANITGLTIETNLSNYQFSVIVCKLP